MITFKQYNKYFCGMLVLICCLFGAVGVVEAGTVDISGRCISMDPIPPFTVITPSEVCRAAGYGDCFKVGLASNFVSFDNNGTGAGCIGVSDTIVMNFDCSSTPTFVRETRGIRATDLLCNSRTWGIIPKPDNVPGDFRQSIKNITDWILGFIAMIAVLMLIWGGVNYLTSAGDEDKAKTGKKTIQYAIIGLVVAGIAYAVVNVIITVVL